MLNPFTYDFVVLWPTPELASGFYAVCLLIAFWRCRAQFGRTITLAFLITRCIVGVLLVGDVATGAPFWEAAWAIYQVMIGCVPFILARPERRVELLARLSHLTASLPAVTGRLRHSAAEIAMRGASSTVAVSTNLARVGASHAVAAFLAIDEQRKLASAARAERQANGAVEGEQKSDFEVLVEKYGEHKPGREAVTIYDPEGKPRTIWMKRRRQWFGPNTHLWFHGIRTAAFIGFGIYLLMLLPDWLRPAAGVAGIAGYELLTHFNPLHFLGL